MKDMMVPAPIGQSEDDFLAGRLAMVTGGSRGVGAAIAREFARRGATVAVTYRRAAAAADAVVDDIRARGGKAMAVLASAADESSWTAAVDTVRDQYGTIDLLVSNAGVASRGNDVLSTASSEFNSLLAVHALGPTALIRHLLPAMRTQCRGDILMISSTIVNTCPANSAPYAMAKAAMEAMCRVLAQEERDYGIRVNIIAPGLVDTDMGAKLVAATKPGDTVLDVEANSPFGRICKPIDVARVAAFLAGPGGEYITGQRIIVDGGGVAPAVC